MGKKGQTYDREYSKTQKLAHENKKLQKEVASLKRQLAKLDLDRYSYVKETLDDHYALEDQDTHTEDMLQSLKNQWSCFKCSEGFLEINLYTRQETTYYYRKCNCCSHRTTSKPYSSAVKGIVRTNTEPPKRSK